MESTIARFATDSRQLKDGRWAHIIRNPGDVALATAYIKLNQEDLLTTVWHMKVPGLRELLKELFEKPCVLYSCLLESNDRPGGKVDLVGLGWAWDMLEILPNQWRASVGVAFFRDYQHRDITVPLASMCINDGFEKMNIIAQYGITPVQNEVACKFHRGIGFEVIGILPQYSSFNGQLADCQCSVMTKERWARLNAGLTVVSNMAEV